MLILGNLRRVVPFFPWWVVWEGSFMLSTWGRKGPRMEMKVNAMLRGPALWSPGLSAVGGGFQEAALFLLPGHLVL